jgi:EAL domain-containing protein (putative c-di-GMP-specific phosphodiesterase class I)
MNQQTPDIITRLARFGRRKFKPRVCIADGKAPIRIFLADALEDFGFVICEYAIAAELSAVFEAGAPDLVVLGSSVDGIESREILEILADRQFDGRVLPIGPRDSILLAAIRQFGEESGIAMLPTLPTPFGVATLRESVAMFLPIGAAPSPPVDVAEALEAGWLELWYQQKIDARTLVPRGAEALVRLRHPAWGVVAPARFIPDDDDPNFRSLSNFVIGRALDDWHYFVERHGPIDISINLPLSFLEDRQAIRDLCRQIPTHPAFNGLLIEIASAEAFRNLRLVADVAGQVRFHNIAVSIDDLGIEWPSLIELDTFPFAELKVDRQFVTGSADDRLKQTVCRAIVEFAAGHGARTVAEGVETRADFLSAHEMGFDLVQGFLFGKPMGSRKFARSALAQPVLMLR